jgi:hypothetical protein
MNKPKLRVLSLGAGVQSTTLALMAAHGEFEHMPDCAIFADTGAEPRVVYKHLEWLMSDGILPFPVHIVSAGNLWEDELRIRTSAKSGKRYMKNSIPAFVKKASGGMGLLGRKCTSDYKLVPIQRKVRDLLGISRATKNTPTVEMWVGISTDEASRMKPSQKGYIVNRWPLIEKNISREGCLMWLAKHGYPPAPRSACVFCPFHSDDEWVKLKTQSPDEFERAARFEISLQQAAQRQDALVGTPFLHKSGAPLSEVLFAATTRPAQLDMFNNECEGMCGV